MPIITKKNQNQKHSQTGGAGHSLNWHIQDTGVIGSWVVSIGVVATGTGSTIGGDNGAQSQTGNVHPGHCDGSQKVGLIITGSG